MKAVHGWRTSVDAEWRGAGKRFHAVLVARMKRRRGRRQKPF